MGTSNIALNSIGLIFKEIQKGSLLILLTLSDISRNLSWCTPEHCKMRLLMIAVFILPLLLEVRSESQNIEEKELAILDELLRVVTDIKEEWELKDIDQPDAQDTLAYKEDDNDESSEEDDGDDED